MANSYDERSSDTEHRVASMLLVLTIIGVALGYITSVLTARLLGPAGFEDYAVAIATLGLLTGIAEAGVGKYALKILPAYGALGNWSLAAGYWRFSLQTVLLVSMLLGIFMVGSEALADGGFARHPLAIAVLFLPAAAVCGAGVDFVMANRAPMTGEIISRLVVPGTTLVLLAIAARRELDASIAVTCFGFGSVAGAIMCVIAFRRTTPPLVLSSQPDYRRAEWIRECVRYAAFVFLASWIFRISVLVLEMLPIAESEVAYFAAAMDTGCLILLLAKSTDKLFQPQLSIIIHQGNWDAGISLRRKRYVLVGSVCAAFLATMIVFGKQVLGLYGPDFRNGYVALCLVSIGTCAWTMFSLAPAYLNYTGRTSFVIATTIAAALAMAVLTAVLGRYHGATGAAAAICIVLTTTSCVFLAFAAADFSRRKESPIDN
jgi:O-antigen/teichoic acid export membrane protein